jgi:hypothetical protein
MKKIFLGVVIGSLVTALLFYYCSPRPGPGEPVVIHEDKIISGQISGQAQIKPKISQEDGDNNSTNKVSGEVTKVPETGDNDFTVNVPVTGEIKTKFVDLQFTGVTTVERKGDNLTVNTTFDDYVKETIYQEPVRTWHVGLGVVAVKDGLGMGGFVQKDFPIQSNLIAFGRVEADREVRAEAGIEFSF